MSEVSVIIPTYERAKYVTKAINSVLAQTYKNYEIIVVDDGSKDNTRQVLETYKDKIIYLYQENAGVSAARNAGIRAARGKWIAFLDSDDIWFPDKLLSQMECVNRTHAKVCFTSTKHVGKEIENVAKRKPYREEIFQEPFDLILQDSLVLYVQSMLIELSLIEQMQGFDERLEVAEDTSLIYKLALETPFAYIDEPLVYVNRDEQRQGLANNGPSTRSKMRDAHIEIISRAYFRCYKKRGLIIKKLRYILGHYLSNRAISCCVEKNYSDARRSARDALHFGGNFRTYRRSIIVLFFPWLVNWTQRNRRK
ncbi:glycosyltransferase family 2 protein [Candidatus Pacearchaeota archaeon]|nr:glycosyltransferase family 2 protein [Candidatus Pacearchaeota archaeon]